MTAVNKTQVINAPVETVYEYCQRPDFLVDFAPTAISVRDVEQTPSGGQRFNCVHEVAGVQFDEACEMDWADQDYRIVETSDSQLLKTETTYLFKPADGGSEAEITAELTVPILLIGSVAERLLIRLFVGRELDGLLINLKAAAESESERN